MIPEAAQFPETLDTDENLYLVHDALRVRLAEDYLPGDTRIIVEPASDVMAKFPPTGLITLTEQCSDIENRAISFHYSEKGDDFFGGLELLPGFTDSSKPKRITNVVQNVMAEHHNNLKDTLISIEKYIGVKGTTDAKPFGETLEGRVNFLLKKVLTPKAWFSAVNTLGLAPLVVEFQESSLRVEGQETEFLWNFDVDNNSLISNIQTIEATDDPIEDDGVLVRDPNGGKITKIYNDPGKYKISLTVTSPFGSDKIEFPNFVTVLHPAPDEAKIRFNAKAGSQETQPANATGNNVLFDRLATRPSGGYTKPPAIRSAINTFIDMEVPNERYLSTDRSYAGELLDGDDTPVDPVITYTWSLGDDLTHGNSNKARASYSVGGIYDLRLRVDTQFGSYRITNYENCVDIIERQNLWLFTISGTAPTETALGHEYGLISETFKTAQRTINVARRDGFLDGIGALDANNQRPAEIQAKREFARNTGFTPTSSTSSGDQGKALLFWAKGSDTPQELATQRIGQVEYEGFSDTHTLTPNGDSAVRPWNWVFLPSGPKAYFVFGPDVASGANSNLASSEKLTINVSGAEQPATTDLLDTNYKDGALELQKHVTSGYTSGEPNTGRFAVYRSAWKDQTGYVVRNGGAGAFFRLNSFYKTEGTISEPFIDIRKLPDISGPTKLEGQLVSLADGIFFFSNSGSISLYDDTAGVWEVGGPSAASPSFRSVQDSTAAGFDAPDNTLLAVGDGDRSAYLSFDYSTKAFIKFNAADLTFVNLGARPSGEQWMVGVY